jgi:putative membrane protein
MKENLQQIVKGVAMGAANIIPGVSGGTIALITGIFERLINAIKSIDLVALKWLFAGNWNAFSKKIDFWFLVRVFAGVGIAIFSLARIFDFLFTHYPVFIWAYFFGLILASVYYVGITVEKWTFSAVLSFSIGAGVAIAITFLSPAAENRDFFYLILCGTVAVCSMILPGISGSFVLLLMGNYQLVAIEAVNNLDMKILTPVLIGMAVGLILFSHILSWLFKTFKNQTIASLTGFIFGSLGVIWPWKETVYVLDSAGAQIIKKGKPLVERYISVLPEQFGTNEMLAIALVIAGILTIWLVEKSAVIKTESQ